MYSESVNLNEIERRLFVRDVHLFSGTPSVRSSYFLINITCVHYQYSKCEAVKFYSVSYVSVDDFEKFYYRKVPIIRICVKRLIFSHRPNSEDVKMKLSRTFDGFRQPELMQISKHICTWSIKNYLKLQVHVTCKNATTSATHEEKNTL